LGTSGALPVRPDFRKSVFISHSSKDAGLVVQLCELLETRGIGCWQAPRDMPDGLSYADQIVRGIEAADILLLLASQSAVSSTHVMSEVEQAHKRQKRIITVLIGKPKVTNELDFYISRVQHISFPGSAEGLADRVVKAVSAEGLWSEALRRRMLHWRSAFAGSALAVVLVLSALGVGGVYWLRRQLDLDFRRLGYVALSGQRPMGARPGAGEANVIVSASVWLLAENVPFREIRLSTVTQGPDGHTDRMDHSARFHPDQVGSVEAITFVIPAPTTRLTTCLVVPSPGLHDRYRVTQVFAVSARGKPAADDHVVISPIAEPKVARDNGGTCN